MTASAEGGRARDRANEQWGGEARGDEYDAERFYTEATDRHHHSDRQNVRFPPNVIEQASALIATGNWPVYPTVHALIRDALVHRLAWLAEHPPDEVSPEVMAALHSLLQTLMLENTLGAYRRELEAAGRVEAELHAACAEGLQRHDHEALGVLLDTVRQHVDGFRNELATPIYALIDHYYEQLP